jgi:hypothetical protein
MTRNGQYPIDFPVPPPRCSPDAEEIKESTFPRRMKMLTKLKEQRAWVVAQFEQLKGW